MKILKSVMLSATAVAVAMLPIAGHAQSKNPVTNALKGQLQRSSEIMVKAAEEMPADKYSFRPTPGSWTYGHLIMHVGDSNRMGCHWLTGYPAAPKSDLTPTSPKAELVASLKSSFAYCKKAIATFNDSKLSGMVPFYGGHKLSAAAVLLMVSGDWENHYAQQAAYLRRNGMLPPTAHHGKP
jgi:hypothetical protein